MAERLFEDAESGSGPAWPAAAEVLHWEPDVEDGGAEAATSGGGGGGGGGGAVRGRFVRVQAEGDGGEGGRVLALREVEVLGPEPDPLVTGADGPAATAAAVGISPAGVPPGMFCAADDSDGGRGDGGDGNQTRGGGACRCRGDWFGPGCGTSMLTATSFLPPAPLPRPPLPAFDKGGREEAGGGGGGVGGWGRWGTWSEDWFDAPLFDRLGRARGRPGSGPEGASVPPGWPRPERTVAAPPPPPVVAGRALSAL